MATYVHNQRKVFTAEVEIAGGHTYKSCEGPDCGNLIDTWYNKRTICPDCEPKIYKHFCERFMNVYNAAFSNDPHLKKDETQADMFHEVGDELSDLLREMRDFPYGEGRAW